MMIAFYERTRKTSRSKKLRKKKIEATEKNFVKQNFKYRPF